MKFKIWNLKIYYIYDTHLTCIWRKRICLLLEMN
nr:MAG TPA: hypothetical protein [Caudoviricetes sp.]